MSYSLSILDKSPIADGKSAHDALRFTVRLARRAERWVTSVTGSPSIMARQGSRVPRPRSSCRICSRTLRASASAPAA